MIEVKTGVLFVIKLGYFIRNVSGRYAADEFSTRLKLQ